MTGFTLPEKIPKSPFPVPGVHTTTMVLEHDEFDDDAASDDKKHVVLGLELKQELLDKNSNYASPPRIVIASIHDDSPFDGSAVQAQQQILSIHGVAPADVEHAVHLLAQHSSKDDSAEAVTLTTVDACPYPATKMIVVPSSSSHPGLSFDACRGRCLVQVSRIFSKGPFAALPVSSLEVETVGSDEDPPNDEDEEEAIQQSMNQHNAQQLVEGDIVLAVNGIPVAKPEDADAALRQSRADGTYTTIYAMDMAAFRQGCLTAAQSQQSSKKKKTRGGKQQTATAASATTNISLSGSNGMVVVHDERVCAKLICDTETLHVSDPERFRALDVDATEQSVGEDVSTESIPYTAVHAKIVLPFIQAYNAQVEERLTPLEQVVAGEAWMALGKLMAAGTRRSNNQNNKNEQVDVDSEDGGAPVDNVLFEEQEPFAAIPVSTDSKSFAEMSC